MFQVPLHDWINLIHRVIISFCFPASQGTSCIVPKSIFNLLPTGESLKAIMVATHRQTTAQCSAEGEKARKGFLNRHPSTPKEPMRPDVDTLSLCNNSSTCPTVRRYRAFANHCLLSKKPSYRLSHQILNKKRPQKVWVSQLREVEVPIVRVQNFPYMCHCSRNLQDTKGEQPQFLGALSRLVTCSTLIC